MLEEDLMEVVTLVLKTFTGHILIMTGQPIHMESNGIKIL
jgi:hypothetical protein